MPTSVQATSQQPVVSLRNPALLVLKVISLELSDKNDSRYAYRSELRGQEHERIVETL